MLSWNYLCFGERSVTKLAGLRASRADADLAARARRWLPAFALTFGVGLAGNVAPVAAAVLEGEALYHERIMPPAAALLVVTVWDAARADAPATELASARQRLAGGPPYRWALVLDDRLVAASPGAVVRARIEAGGALWMTTDAVTPAFSTSPPALVLRMVQATPPVTPAGTPAPGALPGCAQAVTQAQLNTCAYDEFLDASAGLAARLREVEARLSPAQRSPWHKVQKAWLGYRTEACRFESAGSGTGNDTASVRPMVQWLCNSRLTRMRSEELARILACPEGDVSCVLRRQAGGRS